MDQQTPETLHTRVRDSLAAFTRQLGLQDLTDVYTRNQYSGEMLDFPCVVWTCEGEMEEDADSQTWETVDVWLPCRCYIAAIIETGNEAVGDKLLGWRGTLLTALRKLASLENVPECGDVRIKYGVVIDPKLPQYATVHSALTVQALCRVHKPAEDNKIQEGPLA